MHRSSSLIACLAALTLGASLDACSNFDNCENRLDCGPYEASSAGTGNSGGDGSMPTAGNAGRAGADAHGGTSSVAGGGGQLGCTAICPAEQPICDVANGTCVECLADSQCTPPNSACNTQSKTCVECTASKHCDGERTICDPLKNTCVQCLSNADCQDPQASQCVEGECKPCTDTNHCSHISGKNVCDAGSCVQCTGRDYAACGTQEGKPLVCDSVKRACSTNQEQSAGDCQPCVSDAQCKPGQLCVMQKFGSPALDVGYFCFWKEGDPTGKPHCLPDARPYVKSLENAQSIDGAVSNICGLRSTTCIAHNQFSAKDCTKDGKPDDSLCGFSAGRDSKCVKTGGTYRCTMRCLSYDDCKGDPGIDDGACDTGADPDVCRL